MLSVGTTFSLGPVCEGSEVTLSCSGDLVISQVDVFYGANNTANVAGCSVATTDNCDSSAALGVVEDLCLQESSCTFSVSNTNLGGDPCRGTVKFFEVSWTCGASPRLSFHLRIEF